MHMFYLSLFWSSVLIINGLITHGIYNIIYAIIPLNPGARYMSGVHAALYFRPITKRNFILSLVIASPINYYVALCMRYGCHGALALFK